jgi:hypothetical protein
MNFDDWLAQAWVAHASDPAAVAADIGATGLTLAGNDAQLAALAQLAHHVHGEHLGDWAHGQQALWHVQAHAAAADGARAATQRGLASLALCAGEAQALEGLDASTRVRAAAMAAANLAGRDTRRAQALFEQALAEAQGLPDSDPCMRALAVTGHNLACALEEKAGRSADERALMILAAQTSRRCWALAGTWLETERAEYRLAMSWLAAGDAAQARHHAQACLDTVKAHDGAALERFFAWEAITRSAATAAARASALAAAEAAFGELAGSDRSACQSSLDRLRSGGLA